MLVPGLLFGAYQSAMRPVPVTVHWFPVMSCFLLAGYLNIPANWDFAQKWSALPLCF